MYYSQYWTAQDQFVAETLEFKKDGTFLAKRHGVGLDQLTSQGPQL